MKLVVSIRQRSFARYVAFDLAEAARRLGWAVHWIDFDARAQVLHGQPADAWQAALDAIAADVRAFEPDLVVSYGLEAFVPPFPQGIPDADWRLADVADAPVACFFYDFGPPFDQPTAAAARPWVTRLQRADVRVFCWDRHALGTLERCGIAAEYLPMAVNEAMFFPPRPGTPRDLPVLFSGGPTPERIAALRPLVAQGLEVYGYDEDGWRADPVLAPAYRGFVPERDRLRTLYQRAQVTLNVTRAHGPASLNMRVFEAMACGCLVVTDRADEASTLFTPGRDLVALPPGSCADDVVGQLLDDPATRERIASAGADTVRREHTYVRRLETIAPRLRSFVAESRAWPHWHRFLGEDPARALRFVEALRADRPLLREDLWHLADATALTRLGRVAAARRATERARMLNPALHEDVPEVS